MPDAGPDARRWLPAAVACLALALYLPTLGHALTGDDVGIVGQNDLFSGEVHPLVRLGRIVTAHYWSGYSEEGDLYRPLTLVTYWLNGALSGSRPWAFHLVNTVLHALVSALVVVLSRRLGASDVAGLVAGILFAVHPVHTEAVAGIVGRAEILSAAFVLGAWLQRDRPWVAAALFSGGLLSKENAVVLPGLLLVEDLVRTPRRNSRRLYAALLAALVGYLLLRFAVLGGIHAGVVEGPFDGIPAAHRVLTAVVALGRYMGLLVWPARLLADYTFEEVPLATSALDVRFLMGAGAAALCLASAWALRLRWPLIALGAGLFFVALLPASNIPFGVGVVMAERLLYLPSVGFCLGVGAALPGIARRISARRGALVAVMASFILGGAHAARTWIRLGDWRDQLTLCEATLRDFPRSARMLLLCGSELQSRGRTEDAETFYRRSAELDREDPRTHYNLGTILEQRRLFAEAEEAYRAADGLQPDDVPTLNNLGRVLLAQGKASEAIQVLRRALSVAPGAPAPAGNLAAAWLESGDPERAERMALMTLRLHPGSEGALRVLEAIRRRWSGAIRPAQGQPR